MNSIKLVILFLIISTSSIFGQNFDVRLVIDNSTEPSTLKVEMQKATAGDVPAATRLEGTSFNLTQGAGDIVSLVSTSISLSFDSNNDIIGNTLAGGVEIGPWTSGEWQEVGSFTLNPGTYAAEDFVINPTMDFGQLQNIAFIDVPGISPFGGEILNVNSSILPVEFVSFKAKKQDNHSALSWQTATEINNDFFEVQRSSDSRNFISIGRVQGSGTTNDVQNYDFLDRNPNAGSNYYRLKQVDYNGAFEYSNIELVDFSEGRVGIEVFPNPTADYITVSIEKKYDNIKVLNNLGQIVKTITSTEMENNEIKVNVSDYTPGIYFLEAKAGTEIVNKQFVKVN